jgi:predicted outer membrane repeat protein
VRAALLLSVLSAALALLFTGVAPAGVPATVNCANLDAALAGATPNTTITLNSQDGTETGPDGGKLCAGMHTIKTQVAMSAQVTLEGDPTNGKLDGLDGTGGGGRVLTGTTVGRFEVSNLVVQDSTSTGNGGAISVTGDSTFTARNSQFFNNHADSGSGGAVYVAPSGEQGAAAFSDDIFGSVTDPTKGNSASTGGAIAMDTTGTNVSGDGVNGSTFGNNVAKNNGGAVDWNSEPAAIENMSLDFNTFTANKAGRSGGAVHLLFEEDSILHISGNPVTGNALTSVTGAPSGVDHSGGGLFLERNNASTATTTQNRNVFQGNSVGPFTTAENDLRGGGQAVTGNLNNVLTEFETYKNNTVAPPAPGHHSQGGGLFFLGGTTYHGWLALLTGNQASEGGGAFNAGSATSNLEFADSTITANKVNAGGSRTELSGSDFGTDTLKLTNTIAQNPASGLDIDEFENYDVHFSDACQFDGVSPIAGEAMICADPLLADPANGDIHETGQSPTIDKGNDALFLAEEEDPCCDFENDPRPVDGDGDGHTVDIGADESPAFVKPPVVVTPAATAQCVDGKDNDSDGAIDLKDPGCGSAADNNEGDESLNDLVLCGRRQISLVRADAKGKRVVLSGLVAAKFAGKTVTISANYGKKKLATVKAGASGAFKATVKGPSARFFKKARLSAKVDKFKSVALKLPQSLASSSVKKVGATIVLRGKVKRALLGKRNAVVVRRIVCGRYTTVGQAKPNKKGSYVVRFKAPGLSTSALYRAETKVLSKPRGKRYVKQFARAVGITLTGQTG